MYRHTFLPTFVAALLVIVTGCSDQLTGPNQSASGPQAAVQSGPGGTSATTAASCDETVSPGDAIQTAIDNASAGAVICVEPGTYAEDVSVDKALTLQGTTDPTGSSPAILDGQLAVEEDGSSSGAGAIITKLKIAPSAAFDIDGTGIDPAGIKVTVSDVAITENVVDGLIGDATGGSSSGTVHGIQVWNGGEPYVTNVSLTDNTVRNIENQGDASAGWPNYGGAVGIKVQGVVRDIEVTGNTVRGVHSAGWVYGVTLTHTNNDPQLRSPENVTVTGNTVAELNDGSVYGVFAEPAAAPYPGVAVAIDDTENPSGPGGADADQATVSQNNFLNVPIGTQNKDQVHTLVAECNYWGHASGPSNALDSGDKGAEVVGDVDFTPWSVRKIGQGGQSGNSCVGGRDDSGDSLGQ
jgi:hypothetical protein